jgi:hypothetical protein
MNSKSGTQLAHWTGHIPSKIAVRVVYSGLFAILFPGIASYNRKPGYKPTVWLDWTPTIPGVNEKSGCQCSPGKPTVEDGPVDRMGSWHEMSCPMNCACRPVEYHVWTDSGIGPRNRIIRACYFHKENGMNAVPTRGQVTPGMPSGSPPDLPPGLALPRSGHDESVLSVLIHIRTTSGPLKDDFRTTSGPLPTCKFPKNYDPGTRVLASHSPVCI